MKYKYIIFLFNSRFTELTNKTSNELEIESETRYQKFKEIFHYKNT